MTPAKRTAALVIAKVQAATIGTEMMQPMPPGWDVRARKLLTGEWEVESVGEGMIDLPLLERYTKISHSGPNESLAEAHRLCREKAWEKYRISTGMKPDEARRLCREEAERKAQQ
jgi:hypothetical protein